MNLPRTDSVDHINASNNSVDDIRNLIDQVRYPPQQGKFKVYIIDEVHMLSNQAFNAFLKTLEEPPPHVTFIFATTETRKVPITVLSRCQRFDLRRVDAERLALHFQAIAEKEGATVETGALQLIARVADGSVRDGLSLLDQAIAFGALEVTAEMVREMLGLADRMRHFDIFDALMEGNIALALDELGQAYAASGEIDKAERYFNNVIEKRPGQAQPLVELAKLQLSVSKYREAIALLKKAKKLTEHPDISLLLVQALQFNQEYQEALVYLNSLIESNESDSYFTYS